MRADLHTIASPKIGGSMFQCPYHEARFWLIICGYKFYAEEA